MILIIIPTDRIDEYEQKGLVNLEEYYNPGKLFDEVILLSPIEIEARTIYGIDIIPVKNGEDYKKHLAKLKPDVIRAYGGYWPTEFAVKNRMKNIPIISSVHDTNPNLLYGSIRYVDHVICMTKAVSRIVVKRGVAKERVSILPNRVSLETFFPGVKHSGKQLYLNETNYLLHIGRKTHQKNLELIIKSLPHLPNDWKLVAIGKETDSSYRSLVNQMGLDNRVIFLDHVRNDQLPAFYSKCRVFVCPSRWEGFGVVIIEAAACSTKIVCSGIEVFREILTDEVNALMIDDLDDHQLLAKKIMLADSSPELGFNARKCARQYDRPAVDQQEIKIYQEVIATDMKPTSPGIIDKINLQMEAILKRKIIKLSRLFSSWRRRIWQH